MLGVKYAILRTRGIAIFIAFAGMVDRGFLNFPIL